MNACWRRCRTMVAEFVSLLLRVDIVIRTRDGPKTIYSPMFYIPYLVLIVILARNIINSGSSDWLSEQFFVRFQVSYRAISTTMKSLIKRMRYPTPYPCSGTPPNDEQGGHGLTPPSLLTGRQKGSSDSPMKRISLRLVAGMYVHVMCMGGGPSDLF